MNVGRPTGSPWRTPCWSPGADSGPWCSGCDGQATAGWCASPCRIRAGGRQGVAQRVRGDRLGDAGPAPRLFTGVLHGESRDRLIGDVAGKQEILRVDGTPIRPENLQQPRREHHAAILPPLALLHADDHPLAVDRRWRQADRFGDTQAGRVADGQDGAMLPAIDGVEEPGDLVLAEHDRKLLRLATGGDDLVDAPTPSERDLV